MARTEIDSSLTEAKFYDRGDPSTWDFEIGDLTADFTWHDLDLSSIIPSGATGVVLFIEASNTSSGEYFYFRKNGNTNAYNVSGVYIPVAGTVVFSDLILGVDTDGKIEYRIKSGGSWTTLRILVKGWFK